MISQLEQLVAVLIRLILLTAVTFWSDCDYLIQRLLIDSLCANGYRYYVYSFSVQVLICVHEHHVMCTMQPPCHLPLILV